MLRWLPALALLAVGCSAVTTMVTGETVKGSGTLETKTFPLDGFTGIEISNAFTATVERGDGYAVSVTVDDNFVQYLKVEKSGDKLVIRLDAPGKSLQSNGQHEAKIKLPELKSLSASGACTVTLGGFSTPVDRVVSVTGASGLSGSLNAGALEVTAVGASTVTLTGTAKTVKASATGASTVKLGDLAADVAVAEALGASTTVVRAKDEVKWSATGASTVKYRGNPAKVSGGANGASSGGAE